MFEKRFDVAVDAAMLARKRWRPMKRRPSMIWVRMPAPSARSPGLARRRRLARGLRRADAGRLAARRDVVGLAGDGRPVAPSGRGSGARSGSRSWPRIQRIRAAEPR